MREFFGGLLALASLAAMLISIIAIIRPLPKLKLPTRGRAALALVGSFVLIGVAGAVLPPEYAEKGKASTGAPTTTAATKPATPTPDMTAEVVALFEQVKEEVRGCDAASQIVADAFDKNHDVYELYEIVGRATERCKDSWQGLNGLKPPPSARGEIKSAFQEALETCSTAYFSKFDAYEKISKVIDGDNRPSAVSKAKESMEFATTGQMVCVAGFLSAGSKAGVSMETLSGDKAS